MAPDLDLEVVKGIKWLLLGSGSLGCQIGRNLLSWGFENFTFVDNGKVSYSNPVRQCLFTFKDSVDERSKAESSKLKCWNLINNKLVKFIIWAIKDM